MVRIEKQGKIKHQKKKKKRKRPNINNRGVQRTIKNNQEETKKENPGTEAHLTIAIMREDYSIALTKCF